MKSRNEMKDEIVVRRLKKEDPIELPMDEKFFEKMHNQIMQAIDPIEIKSPTRIEKAWIFLETRAWRPGGLTRKIIKTSFAGIAMLTGLSVIALCAQIYINVYASNHLGNQARIVREAKNNPVEWAEMVSSYQNENDFYADVLSQRNDLGTIVEIDRVITGSL